MKKKISELLAPYRNERGALIPILQHVQAEFGYLPEEVVKEISQALRLSESEIYGVATFYAQFRFMPTGKNVIRVCRGTACHVRGGARIRQDVEKMLGIRPGETSPDMQFSLETVACIGCCAIAPTMVINDRTYGQLTPKKVKQILAEARNGGG